VTGTRVVGYVGMHSAADLGHVGTLAVGSAYRGLGIGEALMLAALQIGANEGLDSVVLEYRIGNERAARLYEKLGFQPTRIRKAYYSDTQEDAVEALLANLRQPVVQEHLTALRAAWEARHSRQLPRP